jgi:spore coat protein U-like protein
MTATNIAFGNIDVTTGSAVSSSGTLNLSCNGVPANNYLLICVNIDGGSAYNGSNRLMNGPGAAQLGYQLYSDPGLTIPWGSWPLNLYGGGYSWTPYGTKVNDSWTATVYGSVLANQQTITAGNYSSRLNLYFTYDSHSFANGGSDSGYVCPDIRNQGSNFTIFTARATVTGACAINASTLNFGTVSGAIVQSTSLSSNTIVNVTCTDGSPYAIGMSNGNYPSGSQRRMAYAGNYLNYNLYVDSAHSIPWTTATNSSTCTTTGQCYLGTGTGSQQSIPVYGQFPAVGSQPPPGTYSDMVVMTIFY